MQPSLEHIVDQRPWSATLCETPSWYAVQTCPRHEKRVASQLRQKEVTTLLPLVSEIHRWSDRQKTVELPLFPGYLFVRMPWTGSHRLQVLQTTGVIRLVSKGCEPVPIEDKEIEDLQRLLATKTFLSPYPFLKAGQRVRIRGGCLDGVEGVLVRQNSDSSLIVSIQAIQRSMAVRIDGYGVEPA
jgi:transcription antitermination factor NusG